MSCCFHSRVFCHLPARQLFPMGALSPRRRRVVQIRRQFFVCWPQCSSMGSFCGLRYNPIRIQRLFLHTFSDKPEKVCPRSDGYSVAVKNGSSGANRTSGPMWASAPTKCDAKSSAKQQLRCWRERISSGESGQAGGQGRPPLQASRAGKETSLAPAARSVTSGANRKTNAKSAARRAALLYITCFSWYRRRGGRPVPSCRTACRAWWGCCWT